MATIHPNGLPDKPKRVALYGRVSSEDQQEKQTIKAQQDFLKQIAVPFGWEIAGEYWDDGISGTVDLDKRAQGKRLLADAREHKLDEVVVYRLDRLGRSLSALLKAHEQLEQAGVTICSATEPFDTSNSIGRFVFQLLGSMAELEKETFKERASMGRARATKAGVWTNGPIPYGYDLDPDGHLIRSTRIVQPLGSTEADVVVRVFTRIAEGSSLIAEARSLNALAVPCVRRWSGGKETPGANLWSPGRLHSMVKNPVYRGLFVMNVKRPSEHCVECEVPALVSAETWETAQRQLTRNRKLSTKNATHRYLLRGLVTCENCGASLVGTTVAGPNKPQRSYYRCTSQLDGNFARHCIAKNIPGRWLEDLVWQDCRSFLTNPGEPLAEAERQLRQRVEQTSHLTHERHHIESMLTEKSVEAERITTAYRKGLISIDTFERQITTINQEAATLRTQIDSMTAQADVTQALQDHLMGAGRLLDQLREKLPQADAADGWELRRQIVETLVSRVSVLTEGDGRKKRAAVTLRYAFNDPDVVVLGAPPRSSSDRR